jgi:hypothetical protein
MFAKLARISTIILVVLSFTYGTAVAQQKILTVGINLIDSELDTTAVVDQIGLL